MRKTSHPCWGAIKFVFVCVCELMTGVDTKSSNDIICPSSAE
jgi:hypothetical protein